MMKNKYKLIILLLLCYSCNKAPCTFSVTNNKVCFDTIKQGERINISFNLQNNTKDTIQIEHSSKSCECIAIIKHCKLIHPNSCDSILISFQTNEIGDIVRGITIIDSYSKIPIELLVYGYVK